jgi:phosphatidylinositol alpha-1,6-mannosyltransferase
VTLNAPWMLGGIARHYAAISRNLPPGQVEILTVSRGDGADAPASSFEVPTLELPYPLERANRIANVVRCARRTSRIVKDRHIEVLQIGDLRPMGYVGVWIRARRGVPYVLYVHGADVKKEERKARRSWLKRVTARAILGGAAAIIANSSFTAQRTRELMRTLRLEGEDRIRVVHPGTDPDRFRPSPTARRSVRQRLALGDRAMILTVGRLVPRKGVDMLLAALAVVAARHPDVVLVIAGEGPDRERLDSEARRLGLEDRVRFLGSVSEEELPDLYAAADLFVLPAREDGVEVEGFGIVFSEAAASGLAVIAGDSAGVGDAVRHGETGILVPPSDPQAIAGAIMELLEGDDRRRSMGAAGRQAVMDYYRWERAAGEVGQILLEVSGSRTLMPERSAANINAP